MKWLLLLALLLPSVVLADPVPDTDAAQHAGQTVAVKGTVVAVYTSKAGNTFLNFGAKYPNQTFSGFIPLASKAAVGDVFSLAHHTVTVTGKVRIYQGKPEIVVTSKEQITDSIKPNATVHRQSCGSIDRILSMRCIDREGRPIQRTFDGSYRKEW